MKKILFILLISFYPLFAIAQLQIPGKPAAWDYELKSTPPVIHVNVPVSQKQLIKKKTNTPQPLYAGYTIPLVDNVLQKGVWQLLPDGNFVWRLEIQLDGASALNLYFRNIKLGQKDRLFIYNSRKGQLLGAFSRQNNGKEMGTAYLQGNNLVLELDSPKKYDILPFELTGVGNITNYAEKSLKDFGDAGACEIPVNCPEGDKYKNQKNSVARILLREGSGLFWCTGSLINDTKSDGKPYFLTANHCGDASTAADYARWVFYFNYESPDCSRPATQPAIHALSGAQLLASANYSNGSDFKLLLLKDKVPYAYKPYFNGWDRSGNVSDSGVVIHHPEGDIKMISTYKTPLVPIKYYGTTTDPNADFWKVKWAATISGHGVTEGGSSGSPLFSGKGLVVGTLTGGDASCSTQDSPDYFGRFSKHWDANGSDSTKQLKYWLDKAQTGITQMPGFDPLSTIAIANFSSDVNKTPVGGIIRFTNLSTGPVSSYYWEFEGGNPATSTVKTPPAIQYSQAGTFRVSLSVTSPGNVSTKINSVSVLPVIYPNPTRNGRIHILLGSYKPENITISIYDILGRRLDIFKPQFGNDNVVLQLPDNQNGMYIIRLTNRKITNTYKVLNYHK
jgi:hypothetical protein